MYETQLLKIKIRPGKTEQVVEFIRSLRQREEKSLDVMRREGIVAESIFLERQAEGDYLYYYVKAESLMRSNEINMQSTDAMTLEIRRFVNETWGHIVSPELLLDFDLIHEVGEVGFKSDGDTGKTGRIRRKAKAVPASSPAPHALAG